MIHQYIKHIKYYQNFITSESIDLFSVFTKNFLVNFLEIS